MAGTTRRTRTPPHFTAEELAERLGVTVKTVYHWNTTGTGPKRIKVGRHVRYRVTDVEAWEATREQS